jgi:hypothetical protein
VAGLQYESYASFGMPAAESWQIQLSLLITSLSISIHIRHPGKQKVDAWNSVVTSSLACFYAYHTASVLWAANRADTTRFKIQQGGHEGRGGSGTKVTQ